MKVSLSFSCLLLMLASLLFIGVLRCYADNVNKDILVESDRIAKELDPASPSMLGGFRGLASGQQDQSYEKAMLLMGLNALSSRIAVARQLGDVDQVKKYEERAKAMIDLTYLKLKTQSLTDNELKKLQELSAMGSIFALDTPIYWKLMGFKQVVEITRQTGQGFLKPQRSIIKETLGEITRDYGADSKQFQWLMNFLTPSEKEVLKIERSTLPVLEEKLKKQKELRDSSQRALLIRKDAEAESEKFLKMDSNFER